MRLLVLGGTGFVGRAVVLEALSRGDRVTVFNRGTKPVPPGATLVTGDRTIGLEGLAGTWDVAVDTWSAAPVVVRAAAASLAGRVDRYVYVSSRSVYVEGTAAYADEQADVVPGDPSSQATDDYAAAKRGGELAALEAFGDRALLPRPGLILGPWEDIGRLPWWLGRIARGGVVPAPGPPGNDLQYVDARDLASWLLTAADQGLYGAYNTVSPPGSTTMRELLETCLGVTGSDAELRWLTPKAIAAAGVEPWSELPIWLPPGELHDFLHRGDVARAAASGLRIRPLVDTVADTWAWLQSIGGEAPLRPDRPSVGLSPEAEERLLAG